jgi:Flp pilus assembly protein TadG
MGRGKQPIMYLLCHKPEPNSKGGAIAPTSAKCRAAVATVEFAVLAPFLVFLSLGIYEVARGIMIRQVLNDAARKGCRTGVLAGKSNSDITSDVNNILSDNGISSSNVKTKITISPSGVSDVSAAQAGVDRVAVKLSIPASSFYWISTYFLTKSEIESETVTLLKQG